MARAAQHQFSVRGSHQGRQQFGVQRLPRIDPRRHVAHLGGLVQALYRWVLPCGLGPRAIAIQVLRHRGAMGRRHGCSLRTRMGGRGQVATPSVGNGQVPSATDPKRVDGGRPRFVAGVGVEQHLHFVLQTAQVLGRR